eukprot:CAMPEP_0169161516 /NCGR_PEP_ID=MMETSP1015-20121227/57089_1 /TAXON_ID=342587 /ORGANISM="Karlodinium micrum, Strain CCMP2283" /LENGTH=248 /DNA_ID=CAMNT_0009233383 /DNA_START=69 /DNA_END=812 /DNA_ORIENTATION=-
MAVWRQCANTEHVLNMPEVEAIVILLLTTGWVAVVRKSRGIGMPIQLPICFKDGSRSTPSILVGHSFGASLVTQLDAETRSALANDIFECSDSNDSALLPAPSALCLMSTGDGEGLGGGLAVFYLPEFGLRMLQPTMTSAFAKSALHPGTKETVQRESLAVSEANEMHVCKAFYRQIQWRDPAAAKGAGPALCIHGDSDGVIPLEQGRRVASQFDQAAFHVVERASHQVMEEQPEATVDLLGRLIDNV